MIRSLLHPHFGGVAVRQPVVVPDPVSTFIPHIQPPHYRRFWLVFFVGLLALVGLTGTALAVHSRVAETAFVVGGSAFTPSLYVYYLDLHNLYVDPRWRTILVAFALGALVAVPLAIALELFLPAGTGAIRPALITGAIEEFCKVLVVLWLMRRRYRFLRFEMDGIILGAATGMGFAMLEDILYAVGSFSHGLEGVVVVVWLRAVLGAFGHGTWTAIVAGMLWKAKGEGRPRLTVGVLLAFTVAVLLHAAWDWMPLAGLAAILWWVAVGVVGILILRSMVHEALVQETAYEAARRTAESQA